MKLARDILSLSTFKRDSNKVMRQMKKTKQPVLKERSEVVEILRQRLVSLSSKKGRPAEDFFNELFAENNIAVEDC